MVAKPVDYVAIANSAKALRQYVKTTGEMLSRIGQRLHYTACMTVFHAAEYGDPALLNMFFTSLKVNDQTALKRWIADNFTYQNDEDEATNWMGFTNRKDKQGNPINFHVVKGTEAHRKGVYDLGKLFELESFQNTDVSKSIEYSLNKLIEMVVKAIDTVEKRGEKNDIAIPSAVETILVNTKRDLSRFITDETPANENQPEETNQQKKMIGAE